MVRSLARFLTAAESASGPDENSTASSTESMPPDSAVAGMPPMAWLRHRPLGRDCQLVNAPGEVLQDALEVPHDGQ